MKLTAPKTVRFDAVVKEAGTPVQVTLWTRPEDDPNFMKAVKEKRVATVIQHNVGTKKDYGLVGFHPQERATFLVFPEALGLPGEARIVGIKYEKLAAAEPKGAVYKPPRPKPMRREKAKPQNSNQLEREPKTKPEPRKPEPPKLFKFQSQVELKATQTTTIEVEATSAKEAVKLVNERAKELSVDLARAEISRKTSRPRKNA